MSEDTDLRVRMLELACAKAAPDGVVELARAFFAFANGDIQKDTATVASVDAPVIKKR